jgi:hypothetical protein
MGAITNLVTKVFSKSTYEALWWRSYEYYHPLFRSGRFVRSIDLVFANYVYSVANNRKHHIVAVIWFFFLCFVPKNSSPLCILLLLMTFATYFARDDSLYSSWFIFTHSRMPLDFLGCLLLLRACCCCLRMNRQQQRTISPKPLWHMMTAVSVIMYSTSYSAHNCTYGWMIMECFFSSGVVCRRHIVIARSADFLSSRLGKFLGMTKNNLYIYTDFCIIFGLDLFAFFFAHGLSSRLSFLHALRPKLLCRVSAVRGYSYLYMLCCPTTYHSIIAISTADGVVQHRHEVQKLALKEYYEKHGGASGHH